jgi:hypothetical protein
MFLLFRYIKWNSHCVARVAHLVRVAVQRYDHPCVSGSNPTEGT